jgi:hypothetical protein
VVGVNEGHVVGGIALVLSIRKIARCWTFIRRDPKSSLDETQGSHPSSHRLDRRRHDLKMLPTQPDRPSISVSPL